MTAAGQQGRPGPSLYCQHVGSTGSGMIPHAAHVLLAKTHNHAVGAATTPRSHQGMVAKIAVPAGPSSMARKVLLSGGDRRVVAAGGGAEGLPPETD